MTVMAAATVCRVGSATEVRPLRTAETVPTDTPARRATSMIVGPAWRTDPFVGRAPVNTYL